ncbi:hypothetical protein ACFX2I_039281 [Malus domestica]
MISLTPTPSLVHRIRSAVVFLFPIPNPTREAPKSSEERKLSSDLYSSVPKLFDKKKGPALRRWNGVVYQFGVCW